MRVALLSLLLFSFATATHVSWLGDYDKALALAQKEHKPMMVLLVKKDSKESRNVIVKNFMNKLYIKKLNQKVVSVIITYGSRISYPIELFYSTTFPALFFVDFQSELFLHKPLYGKEINGYIEEVISEILNQ